MQYKTFAIHIAMWYARCSLKWYNIWYCFSAVWLVSVKLENQSTVQQSPCCPLVTGKTEIIDQPLLRVAAAMDQCVEHAGVNLSKYWWRKPKFGGNVVTADKCTGVSRPFWGARPGCPPNSTPMVEHHLAEQSSLVWWLAKTFEIAHIELCLASGASSTC